MAPTGVWLAALEDPNDHSVATWSARPTRAGATPPTSLAPTSPPRAAAAPRHGGCFADNVASWKVMEKLGMRRKEHSRQGRVARRARLGERLHLRHRRGRVAIRGDRRLTRPADRPHAFPVCRWACSSSRVQYTPAHLLSTRSGSGGSAGGQARGVLGRAAASASSHFTREATAARPARFAPIVEEEGP